MAHKKAGGSSRNGRDSNGQRRGVKRYGGQLFQQEVFWSARWGQRFTPGRMWGSVKIIHFMPGLQALLSLRRGAIENW